MAKKRNLEGETFGRLTVVSEAAKRRTSPNSVWTCMCACGTQLEAFSHNLIAGRTLSCGCYKALRLAETADKRIAAVKAYWAKYRAKKIEENPPE